MSLFLVSATTTTIYSPGDDGMSEPIEEQIIRLVEADSWQHAETKFLFAIEKDEPCRIMVRCDNVKVHETIR